jgi:excinuclease ABC subunit C
VEDVPDDELMANILGQFYEADKPVPPMILVEILPGEVELLQNWLSRKKGGRVQIRAPQRGDRRKLILMAKRNAVLDLKSKLEDTHKLIEDLLTQLQKDLHLPRLPRRIEGFDISNLGLTEAVGSMVFWQDAKPLKSKYRRFKIKGVEGIDDYGMMAEVINRRYTRLLKDKETMPDLILIDGGKGHLNAGLNVFSGLGISEVPMISLAKREELIYVPGSDEPLDLPARSPTLQLLQRIRDEAHRFAITYQRSRRAKRSFSSLLDEIPGVGPKRKKKLLKHFSGLDKIREASESDLAATTGIDRSTAKRVFEYFHKNISHH